jgi:hypothetical protein
MQLWKALLISYANQNLIWFSTNWLFYQMQFAAAKMQLLDYSRTWVLKYTKHLSPGYRDIFLCTAPQWYWVSLQFLSTYTTQLFGESSSLAICYVNNFLLHYTICIRQIPLMLPSLLATSWLSGQLSKATPDFRSVNFICFTVYFNTFLLSDLVVLASFSFAATVYYLQAIYFYTALFMWQVLLTLPCS